MENTKDVLLAHYATELMSVRREKEQATAQNMPNAFSLLADLEKKIVGLMDALKGEKN